LKIATFEDLNDPFDLRPFGSSDKKIRDALDRSSSTLSKNRGILCFSSKWSNPVLWSHYADRHRGVALGFDVDNETLAEVSYRPDRPEIDLAAIGRGGHDAEAQMRLILTTKFSHWRYESEWRSFVALNDRDEDSNLWFTDFSEQLHLAEVIVGSLSSITRAELAHAPGGMADRVATMKGRLAFRSFRVVRHRKEALWR
jgi:hypothetical protein